MNSADGSTEAASQGRARPAVAAGLPKTWERGVRRDALVVTGITLVVAAIAAVVLTRSPLGLLLAVVPAAGAYAWVTARIRRRRRILNTPFPTEWEAVLQRYVVYFRVLDPDSQQRFRRELQIFLGETRITGVGTEADTTARVLTAASAIIPIFGFPEWEWHQLSEVLIYPNSFGADFDRADRRENRILGMVGEGALNRIMIVSKPDLIQGFSNAADKRNVGIHEIAHLVDKSDGVIDGVPGVGLERQAIEPWLDLVRRKTAEIEAGNSDLNRYALTNQAEFLAVASEYFFERPKLMQRKHPELHAALQRVFNQDLRTRAVAMARELTRPRRKFGRNSPCPCGSGKKFKKCCLRGKERL